jgi:hypothetical protein
VGIDLILDQAIIEKYFPISPKISSPDSCAAALVQRPAAWNVYADRAREHGAKLMSGRVEGAEIAGNRIRSIRLDRTVIWATSPPLFVIAAGPLWRKLG